MNVADGFQFFCSPGTGVKAGDGWSAIWTGDGTVDVLLDFVNGNLGHQKAIWEVNLVTKGVRYRNKNAKYFSWIPDK